MKKLLGALLFYVVYLFVIGAADSLIESYDNV